MRLETGISLLLVRSVSADIASAPLGAPAACAAQFRLWIVAWRVVVRFLYLRIVGVRRSPVAPASMPLTPLLRSRRHSRPAKTRRCGRPDEQKAGHTTHSPSAAGCVTRTGPPQARKGGTCTAPRQYRRA